MKKWLFFIVLGFMNVSCKKEIEVGDVFKKMELSQREVFADGQSLVEVRIELNGDVSEDRRNVIFTTSSGVFASSAVNNYTTKSEYENGVLVAKASLRASTFPGVVKVTAQPEFDSPIGEFSISDSLVAKPSVPSSVKLEPSSFGIGANFVNDVFLTATLRSSRGSFVSVGYGVLFEDFVMNLPAGGRFRALSSLTADSSKVTGFYAASVYPVATQIKIRCTVLDERGLRTSIMDSVFLNINQ